MQRPAEVPVGGVKQPHAVTVGAPTDRTAYPAPVSRDPAPETAAARLDVDIRFLLANERTLLAWVRTALTLMIAGGGLGQFGSDLPYHSVLAAVLLGLGVVAALLGAVRHRVADRAIRQGTLPPPGSGHYAVAAAVAVVGASLLTSVLLSG